MAPVTKGNGKITKLVARANSGLWMGTFKKENGVMIKRMVLALTLMLMVPFIQVNGKTISSTERAKKVGQMAVATMVVIVMVKSMDRQLTGGQMAQFMRVIG